MNRLVLRVSVPALEFAKVYAVPGAQLHARAESGERVALPAAAFKPFVTHSGISGRFAVYFDQNGRLQSIEPLPPQ